MMRSTLVLLPCLFCATGTIPVEAGTVSMQTNEYTSMLEMQNQLRNEFETYQRTSVKLVKENKKLNETLDAQVDYIKSLEQLDSLQLQKISQLERYSRYHLYGIVPVVFLLVSGYVHICRKLYRKKRNESLQKLFQRQSYVHENHQKNTIDKESEL